MKREPAAFLDQPRYFARRIIEVAENAGYGWTIGDTCWRLACANAVAAEIAFHYYVRWVRCCPRGLIRCRALWMIVRYLVIEVAVCIRAGHHARTAPDAQIVIDLANASFFPFESRAGRARFDARRILAMVAKHRQEKIANCGVLAFFGFEYACVINSRRGTVLSLARKLATVPDDAALKINHHS